MPQPIDYCTLAELKEWARVPDTVDDNFLAARITAASRGIDEDTNRAGNGFGVDVAVVARVYEATHPETLLVDDISTTSGLIVEVGWNTSWTTVDVAAYELRPLNCFLYGRPASTITRTWGVWPTRFGQFAIAQQRVRVTALWGWPAVPAAIKDACLLRAARLKSRRGSPDGVSGWGDLGAVRVSRVDPDYEAYIAPYHRDEA